MSVPFASVLMTSLTCFRFRYFEIACIFNIGLVWRKLIWLTLVLAFIVFVIAWNSAHTHTSILYSQCKLRVCLMAFKNLNRFNSSEHWVPKCFFLLKNRHWWLQTSKHSNECQRILCGRKILNKSQHARHGLQIEKHTDFVYHIIVECYD